MSRLLSVARDGTLTIAAGVSLSVDDSSDNGLEMIVIEGGQEIATLSYMMDRSLSVNRSTQLTQATPRNTPTLLSSGFALETIRPDPLATTSIGYQIVRATDSTELDEVKNGPSHTDSLGALSEVSGMGWAGNNTMLLAYAG
jgi:hypothetical protein